VIYRELSWSAHKSRFTGYPGALPPVPLRPDVMTALEKVSNELWPGVRVIPTMGVGASDGIYTNRAGLPTYGVNGVAIDLNDVRAHGKDARAGRRFLSGSGFSLPLSESDYVCAVRTTRGAATIVRAGVLHSRAAR
jgi:hypothetical protein